MNHTKDCFVKIKFKKRLNRNEYSILYVKCGFKDNVEENPYICHILHVYHIKHKFVLFIKTLLLLEPLIGICMWLIYFNYMITIIYADTDKGCIKGSNNEN